MHQEVYADGIGEVTVSGTIVRIDLVSLSPTERDQSNSPKPVFRERVIMPVEAFANSVELMQKVLQGLIDAGAVKRTPVPAPPEGERHGRGDARLNGSPNFS
jgi:hypothetical protein